MIVRLELSVCSGITLKCVNDIFVVFNSHKEAIKTLNKLCSLQVDTIKLMTDNIVNMEHAYKTLFGE